MARQQLSLGGFVFTSNVDGQFQKAGFGHAVLECHGSLHHLQPLDPRAGSKVVDADDFELPEVDPQTLRVPAESVPRDLGFEPRLDREFHPFP